MSGLPVPELAILSLRKQPDNVAGEENEPNVTAETFVVVAEEAGVDALLNETVEAE